MAFLRFDSSHATKLVVRAAPWVGLLLSLGLLFGSRHAAYFGNPFDARRIPDDTRIQLFYFYHYSDPQLFVRDILGVYHTDGMGDLFRGIYMLAAKLGDPLTLSRALPIPLFVATVAGLAVASRTLGGLAGAWAALALCLGAAVIHPRFVGGLPRAFVYPFMAWALAALVSGRVFAFAALSVIGAGFYPIGAVLGCVTLAAWLLALHSEDRGRARAWSLRRRLLVLALVGVAAGAMLAPFALRVRAYGDPIRPSMLKDFPEAGRGGRPGQADRPPFPPFFTAAGALADEALFASNAEPLLSSLARPLSERPILAGALKLSLGAALVFGFVRLGWVSDAARRLAAWAAAVGVSYLVANALTPSIVVPERYVRYTIPLLVPLAAAGALRGLALPGLAWPPFSWMRVFRRDVSTVPAGRWRTAFMIATATLLFASFGGAGPAWRRPSGMIATSDRPLLRAISELPKSAVVAGWPEGVMDEVPLITRRTAFLTRQTHMPYHTGMTLRLRKRARALIAAYFATDTTSIRRLRDDFGVTHLVVDRTHWQGTPPRYFRPFDHDIQRATRAARGRRPAVLANEGTAGVFADERYLLLDLSRIAW